MVRLSRPFPADVDRCRQAAEPAGLNRCAACRLRHKWLARAVDVVPAGNFDEALAFRFLAAAGIVAMRSLAFAAPAYAEKRVALVVGNNDYRNVPKLQKAVNDARTMGDTLKQLGFTVMVAENQNRQAFSQTLLAFDKAVEAGDTAFFFYAGHGFEIAGQNFLLPTDVPAATEGQEELVRDASVLADRIIERLQNKKVRTAILVFDACRNNPFERSGTRAVAGGGGLAPMTQLPEGVFSMFSAGPRQTALDRLSNNDDQSEFGVHAHLRQGADAARRQPRSGRAAHAAAGQRNGGDGPPQADPGLFRPDGRRRVPERHCRKASRAGSATKPAEPLQKVAALPPVQRSSRRTIPSTRRSRCSRATMAAGPWCSRSPTRRSAFPGGWERPAISARPASSTRSIRAPASGCPTRRSSCRPMRRRPPSRCAMSTLNGELQGPFPISFDPEAALIRDQRKILDMTATSWLSFREFNGLAGLLHASDVVSLRDPRSARRHRQRGAGQGAEDAALRSRAIPARSRTKRRRI